MSSVPDNSSLWWVRSPDEPPRARLFCFPHAGGSAGVFHGWNKKLPAEIEVAALQLPGRENRHREPTLRSMDAAVSAIVDSLAPLVGTAPFVFFGYSLGCLVAFECARRLRKLGRPLPRRLLMAASPAPQRDHARNPLLHRLSEDDLRAELRRIKGTPEAVLNNAELFAFILPVLRADFELLETYRCAEEPPLPVPIACFGGLGDDAVAPDGVADWSVQTSAGFTMRFLPGDHFFVKTAQDELLGHVAREVRLSLGEARLP